MSDVAGGILLIGVGVGALYAAYSGVPQEMWNLFQMGRRLSGVNGQSVAQAAGQTVTQNLPPTGNGGCDTLFHGLPGAVDLCKKLSGAVSGASGFVSGGGSAGSQNPPQSAAGGPPIVQGGPPPDAGGAPSSDGNGGSGHGFLAQGGPYASTVLANGRLAWTPVPSAPTGSF